MPVAAVNPLPLILATILRHRAYFALFAFIVAVAVALGVVLSATERDVRRSSARAADRFDLIVAAPGSETDVVLTAIYLRPGTVPLMSERAVARTLAAPDVAFAAPIAFGDNHLGDPIIGTIPAFLDHLSGGLAEGRLFITEREAVVGAASPLSIGSTFKPEHGMEHRHHGPFGAGEDEHAEHDVTITVVGRMKPTGTPWDRAIAVPVEQVWRTHSLPNGHAPGDERIGPPFDPAFLSGVPAIVLRPKSVAGAYRLRASLRAPDSMAFFPAEVLVRLYGILASAGALVGWLALAAYGLVLLALIGSVFAILSLNRRQFAVLRILGAPRLYLLLCIWGYVAGIIAAGTVAGLALGALGTRLAAAALTRQTGIASVAGIGREEVWTALLIAGIGLVVAIIPAMALSRKRALNGFS